MELNKDHRNENKQGQFIQRLPEQGSWATITCVLTEIQRQAAEWGSFIEDKVKASVLPGLQAGGRERHPV